MNKPAPEGSARPAGGARANAQKKKNNKRFNAGRSEMFFRSLSVFYTDIRPGPGSSVTSQLETSVPSAVRASSRRL